MLALPLIIDMFVLGPVVFGVLALPLIVGVFVLGPVVLACWPVLTVLGNSADVVMYGGGDI